MRKEKTKIMKGKNIHTKETRDQENYDRAESVEK
jgi:hypothetical protein